MAKDALGGAQWGEMEMEMARKRKIEALLMSADREREKEGGSEMWRLETDESGSQRRKWRL